MEDRKETAHPTSVNRSSNRPPVTIISPKPVAAAKNEPPVNANAFSQHDNSGDGATVAKPGLPPRPKVPPHIPRKPPPVAGAVRPSMNANAAAAAATTKPNPATKPTQRRRIEITFVSARPMSEVGFRNEKAAEKPPGGELTNNNTQKDVNDNTFKEATAVAAAPKPSLPKPPPIPRKPVIYSEIPKSDKSNETALMDVDGSGASGATGPRSPDEDASPPPLPTRSASLMQAKAQMLAQRRREQSLSTTTTAAATSAFNFPSPGEQPLSPTPSKNGETPPPIPQRTTSMDSPEKPQNVRHKPTILLPSRLHQGSLKSKSTADITDPVDRVGELENLTSKEVCSPQDESDKDFNLSEPSVPPPPLPAGIIRPTIISPPKPKPRTTAPISKTPPGGGVANYTPSSGGATMNAISQGGHSSSVLDSGQCSGFASTYISSGPDSNMSPEHQSLQAVQRAQLEILEKIKQENAKSVPVNQDLSLLDLDPLNETKADRPSTSNKTVTKTNLTTRNHSQSSSALDDLMQVFGTESSKPPQKKSTSTSMVQSQSVDHDLFEAKKTPAEWTTFDDDTAVKTRPPGRGVRPKSMIEKVVVKKKTPPPKPLKGPTLRPKHKQLIKRPTGPPPPLPSRPGPEHPLFHYVMSTPHAIALYDYEPSHPDELACKASDVIVLEKQVDADWMMGRNEEKRGILPIGFIDIVVPLPEDSLKPPTTDPVSIQAAPVRDTVRDTGSGPRCVARFDFESDRDEELSFTEGAIITLTGCVSEEWLQGELAGRRGIFPLGFVEIIEDLPPNTKPTDDDSSSHQGGAVAQCKDGMATALYDFQGQENELTFEAGDKISVISKVNAEWLYGFCNGVEGHFPANFIDDVPDDIPQFEATKPTTGNKDSALSISGPLPCCVAKYDFEGESDGDLSFRAGDRIAVIEEVDADWLKGGLDGRAGLFPRNFVDMPHPGQQEAPPSQRARALYDYEASQEDEISVRAGDVISDIEMVNDDWLRGTLNGKTGILPAAFVETISPS